MTRDLTIPTLIAALAAFAVYVAIGMTINGGVFEHALDDVYIHLAMAEQIAAGGYGVNADEYSSAASSPLYPLLLLPWAGTEAQRWLPLFWNVVALAAAAAMIGRALTKAELGREGLWIAILAPVGLTMYVVAYSGMENMAHGAASLAIVLGLWRFAETREIGWLLILGVFLAPALRLEGLALALAAGGLVLLLGRPLAGLGLGVLALLPVVALVLLLMSLGLDPLPNSVNAKLPDPTSEGQGVLAGIGTNIRDNVSTYGGTYLAGLTAALWVLAMRAISSGARPQGLVGLAVVAASVAHLAFASMGWMNRYENYLILSVFAAMALLLTSYSRYLKAGILTVALISGLFTYMRNADNYANNMRAIHLQQGEMSRFVKDFVDAPVAVNDLGYVSWNNPHYVLDLWGLASDEALKLRQSDAPPGWATELADAHDVKLAMIYYHWLPTALSADWVLLGALVLEDHGEPLLGGSDVSFYARDEAAEAALRIPLLSWVVGLPDGARFIFPEGKAPGQ